MKKLLVIFIIIAEYALSQSKLPRPDHIVLLILENHAYSQIFNSPEAPFINSLAHDAKAALFTYSYAIEHPSQPNYLHLYSGSNQSVTNDNLPSKIPFNTPNLGRQLIDSGMTYITYSEDLPNVGFNEEISGKYVRKHNPAANWMGTGTNQIPETCNQPFSAFPSTNFDLLPTVCFVVPNQKNNMHDGSIISGDNWIKTKLNNYIQWAKTHNSLLILTFDEDNYISDNKIFTLFIGQMVKGGKYSKIITQHNILRTIEEMYKLPYAGKAKKALPVRKCWNNI